MRFPPIPYRSLLALNVAQEIGLCSGSEDEWGQHSAVVMRFADVSLEHVIAQGGGWTSQDACRRDFIRFWGAEGTEEHDDTEVVCTSFIVARSAPMPF